MHIEHAEVNDNGKVIKNRVVMLQGIEIIGIAPEEDAGIITMKDWEVGTFVALHMSNDLLAELRQKIDEYLCKK